MVSSAARTTWITTRHGPVGNLGRLVLAGRADGVRGASSSATVRFPSFGCTFVRSGVGAYRDEHCSVPLGAGSFVSVFPSHPHWYGSQQGTWNDLFLVFDGPLFHLALRVGLLDPRRPVRQLHPVPYWTQRIDRFRTRPAPRTGQARDAEACELLMLLLEIDATSAAPSTTAATNWYDRSVELLESDLDRRIPMAAIAEQLGMPYETWRRYFTRRNGCSPARHRRERRLGAAQTLLRETSMSTREIAAAVGFVDEQHLARHFAALLGCTPRQYRAGLGEARLGDGQRAGGPAF